jgi:flagellar motor switch protein FliN
VDVRDTYREILVQSLSSLGRSMTTRCQQEVECLQGQFLAVPPDGAVAGLVSFQLGQGQAIRLCVIASPALLETLATKSTQAETTEVQATAATNAENAVAALRSLADLEMPISISFGTARVPLQDALMLKRGSLVALDQRADEPLEFRVNDRIIARGEVVVVEDSYAVRIVELVSRGERLSCANSVQRAEISSPPHVG